MWQSTRGCETPWNVAIGTPNATALPGVVDRERQRALGQSDLGRSHQQLPFAPRVLEQRDGICADGPQKSRHRGAGQVKRTQRCAPMVAHVRWRLVGPGNYQLVAEVSDHRVGHRCCRDQLRAACDAGSQGQGDQFIAGHRRGQPLGAARAATREQPRTDGGLDEGYRGQPTSYDLGHQRQLDQPRAVTAALGGHAH